MPLPTDKEIAPWLDGHKFTLVVLCEHEDKHVLRVPMGLEDFDPEDKAISRFRDALAVAKHTMQRHRNGEV